MQGSGQDSGDQGGDDGLGSIAAAGSRASNGAGAFGPNAWLVEDMYERFLADPTSVSDSWREFFADYRPVGAPAAAVTAVQAPPPTPAPSGRPAEGGPVPGPA